MGHTTDYLVKMANEISPQPNSREMDMLLATGEQVTIALLTMAIQAEGYEAISMNAMQVGIITECVHSKARIVDIKTNKLREHLDKGRIIVVAGLGSDAPARSFFFPLSCFAANASISIFCSGERLINSPVVPHTKNPVISDLPTKSSSFSNAL